MKICSYKVIVKGKWNACHAFFGSMSCMDYKQIDKWIPWNAEALTEDDFWYNTVQERSKMFQVEVQCNSEDIDDPYGGYYEHYINGQ